MYTRNWDALQRPNRIDLDEGSHSATYGRFTIEPLEKGFGVTIGHALRRVLLSSIQGAAVIAVKIEGVSHEFEGIGGVQEDAMQIGLNLKALQINQLAEGLHELELVGAGPCQLKADDIVTGGKVELLNPDLVIADLDDGATLEMRLYVGMGKGYVTAEENQEHDLPSDVIFLDSVHTPIKRINYEVQNARIGQRTDYDKLVLEIWTNGAVKPREALSYSAKIMNEYMIPFIDFEEEETTAHSSLSQDPDLNLDENLYRPVSELELSVRSINCLQSAQIETIGELVQKTEKDMLKTKNFGRKSLNEIKVILSDMGLSLGMKIHDFDASRKPASPVTTEYA